MENLSNQLTEHPHSTYQILIESEEKERTVFESIVYFLLIAATTAAIWQFSYQRATTTDLGLASAKKVAAQPATLRG